MAQDAKGVLAEGEGMNYADRIAAERKRISDCVDSFLAARLSPDCPQKQPNIKNRESALAYYYRRKAK